MTDQVTSIEQSKRLIELGVPAEKASMVYVNNADIPSFKAELASSGIDLKELIDDGHECYPAFTVADLLRLIQPMYLTTIKLNPTLEKDEDWGWTFEFGQISGEGDCGFARKESLVELLVGRIEWIVSNGYKLGV